LTLWAANNMEEEYFEPKPISLGDSVHPSVIERYYDQKYKVDIKKQPAFDQCVLAHSNKICIITLAKSHKLITEGKVPTEVTFKVDAKTDRAKNKVSGKGKKGAQWLTENSPLCHVTCEDGSQYTLYSCIRGHLFEVNMNLVSEPRLLIDKPTTNGYLAIIMPKAFEFNNQMERLLTKEQYQLAMEKRDGN